jgi:4-amino-4-deoxy-L-arabinose transferase-like glycosyltransferase
MSVLLLSVLLRVGAALLLGDRVVVLPGTFDQLSYHALAQRVADGQGFTFANDSWPATRAGEPTAHWSFLLTGFLAAVYRVVGVHPLVARLILAVATGVAVPLALHRLGRRMGDERVGLIAAGWGALYGYFIYYSATLMTEMATIAAILWLLELSLRLAERPTWRRWLVFGLLVGIAGLLRQVALLPVPLVGLWIVAQRRSWQSVGGLALAAAVSMMLLAPVTWRNWHAFGSFVPVNTNAGYAFFWANHPVHGADFMPILEGDAPSYQELIPPELLSLNEAALNDALLERGLGFVREDPLRYVRLSLSRIDDYFTFWPSRRSSLPSNLTRVLSFGVALPFMLAGLWLARRQWWGIAPLWLFGGAYVLLHLLSWALIRYRLPVDGVLLVLAAVAGDALWRRASRGVG